MLIYFNAIITKKGSCSIFCAGAFMSHHDSAASPESGTTGLRTGSLSSVNDLYLSPGAPPEFPPSYFMPQWDCVTLKFLNCDHDTCS